MSKVDVSGLLKSAGEIFVSRQERGLNCFGSFGGCFFAFFPAINLLILNKKYRSGDLGRGGVQKSSVFRIQRFAEWP